MIHVVKYDNMDPHMLHQGGPEGFEDFPQRAQLDMGRAPTTLAEGRMLDIARPLTGFGSGVMKLTLNHRGDAFRMVYAQIGDDIWVVHAFQKKSKTRIKTPKAEIDLIHERLKRLREGLR